MGDFQGHPFRGNQYGSKGGGGKREYDPEAAVRATREKLGVSERDLGRLARANKINWKTGEGIDPDIRDQVIEQAKEELQGDNRRVRKLSGISPKEWKSLDRDQKDEYAIQYVEGLDFKDAVKVFGKEAVQELQNDFGRPEPDLEHLARENKIPANAGAVQHQPSAVTERERSILREIESRAPRDPYATKPKLSAEQRRAISQDKRYREKALRAEQKKFQKSPLAFRGKKK